MAKFLNTACINTSTPKIVETKYGYIFNGNYYNKKTFIPESLTDSVVNGHYNNMSLNNMASSPAYSSDSYASITNTSFRGDRLIADVYEKDIYYVFTEDFYNQAKTTQAYCAKIKETESSFEIIKKNRYIASPGDAWYVSMTQYLGQSKDKLYVLLSSNYIPNTTYLGRTYLMSINKITLQSKLMDLSPANYTIYNKILETEEYIYLYSRCSSVASTIKAIDKESGTLISLKTIPAFKDEIANRSIYTSEAIMTSPTEGYFVDIDEQLTTTQSRMIKFTMTEHRKKAPTTNGQPRISDLRKEVSYTLNGYAFQTQHKPCPLFTKNNHSATHDNPSVAYWYTTAHHVDITFDEDVNIWRAGTSNYPTYNAKFNIKRYNDETQAWDNITKDIVQTTTSINHLQWEKTIENLPAGRYRFEHGGYRMDGGWYLEKATGEDYFGKLITDIESPDDIVVIDNEMLLKDPDTMTFPENVNSNTSMVSCHMFLTEHNNTRYFHKVHANLSNAAWSAALSNRATIKTFRVDEENNVLTYLGESPLSNMTTPVKAFCLSKDKTMLVGLSNGNTFIHKFDPIEEKFVPLKYFAFLSKAVGFDTEGNTWILNDKYELLKYNETIPESLEILFEDTNLEYEGEEISTFITLKAKNYLDEQLDSSWLLKMSGNARFENGSTELEVNTSAEAITTVPIKITGSGVILVYPVLKLDVKNKGAIE